jgi:hypothetical protein
MWKERGKGAGKETHQNHANPTITLIYRRRGRRGGGH